MVPARQASYSKRLVESRVALPY
jgi:hypothetical protein